MTRLLSVISLKKVYGTRLPQCEKEYAILEQTRRRTTHMVEQEEYLEDLYGPAARYAEHRRGDTITYRDVETGQTKEGKIIWICAPGKIGDREIGVTYVVEPPGAGFPDMVFPSDVLSSS